MTDQIQYNPDYFQQGFNPASAPDLNVGSALNQQNSARSSQAIVQALEQNKQIELQNIQHQADGVKALSKFSETLAGFAEKQAYKWADDQYAEGLLHAYENPGTLAPDPPEDTGAATLAAAGQVEAANAAAADVVVPAVRGSSFFQMGARRGQTMQLMDTQYTPFIQERVMADNPQNSQELAVSMANARKAFWSQAPVDRNAMSNNFLLKSVFPKMSRMDNAIAKENRNRILADQSYRTQQESFTAFNADGDVAKLLGTLAITTDGDGNPLGYRGAWDQFTNNLKNGIQNGTYTSADVLAMENQPIPGDPKGRTYGELHGSKFATAKLNAMKARTNLWNAEQADRETTAKMQQQELLDAFLDPNDQDGFTEEQILEAAQQLEEANPGFQATELRNLTKLSVDAKQRAKQEEQVEDLISMGLLTPERLSKMDPEVQRKYMSTAQQQAKVSSSNGGFKSELGIISDAVKRGPEGGNPISATPDGRMAPSVGMMETKMHQYFRQKVQEYAVSHPGQEADMALQDTIAHFNSTAKVGINGYEGMFSTPEQVAAARVASDERISDINAKMKDNPDFLYQANSIYTNEELESMSKGYGNPGWTPNSSLEYIADKQGVDPLTILNKSRKAAGMTELPPTPAQQIVANQFTPAQKAALRNIHNPQVSARTMGSFNKFQPELVPNGLGQVVQQAASAAGVDPAHVAAMMEIESGFNNTAPSYNNSSFGLMQINRAAHPDFFAQNDWRDPQANATYGAQYYAQMLKRYGNDPIAAAMAYNAGPGNYDAYLRGEMPDGPKKTEMINHGRKFQEALYKYGGGSAGNYSPQGLRGTNNKLTSAATSYVGMDTSEGPDAGNNACVWAINKVFNRAGIDVPWGNSVYVPFVKNSLDQNATRLNGPEPGAIVIMQDNGNPPYPHIGLVQADGSIISNSSSRAKFDWVDSPEAYEQKYGRPNLYYKL